MALPIISPLSPVDGDVSQTTRQPVRLSVTSTTNIVKEESISVTVGGRPAITSQKLLADATVQQGLSTLTSSTYTFTNQNIGQTVVTTSLDPRNCGRASITSVSGSTATLERTSLPITAAVTNGNPTVTAAYSSLRTGTASCTNGSTAVTGVGTSFLTEFWVGAGFKFTGDANWYTVASITSATSLTLQSPKAGNSAGVAVTIGYVQIGDTLVFADDTTSYQVLSLGIGSFDLTSPYGGTTNGIAAVRPAFHSTDPVIDWTLQGFAEDFTGSITATVNGWLVECYPAVRLTGLASVDILGNLNGTGTRLNSELDTDRFIKLAGQRPDAGPSAVTSISNDLAAVLAGYPITATSEVWRTADLPGGTTVEVTCSAVDDTGQQATLDAMALTQPVETYSFTTSSRPSVASVSGPLADPFGQGLRVTFSSALKSVVAGQKPALTDLQTWSVTALSPAPGKSLPANPIITGVTAGGTPTYVDLTFATAMQNGAQYRVDISSKSPLQQNSSGNDVDLGAARSVVFTGYGPLDVVEAYKDTSVTTPIIACQPLVEYGGPPITVSIHDLDPDVTAIQLGPSARNCQIVPASFVNNMDGPIVGGIQQAGTGTFRVALNPTTTSYSVAIDCTDNVDNISLESNVIHVSARLSSIPGNALKIRPFRYEHSDVCDRMIGDMPQGQFWLRDGFVVPYTYDPVAFTLDVVEKGLPVKIIVNREGQTGPMNVPTIQTIIPQSLQETVFITLGQGRNLVIVDDGQRRDFIIVRATVFGTILCTIASEVYAFATLPLEEFRQSVFSELSTRLAVPLIGNDDILPVARVASQQTLSTKMAIRSFVTGSNETRTARDLVAAVTGQTPFMQPLTNNAARWWPSVDRLYARQEHTGGVWAHTWMPNECVTRWSSYIGLTRSLPQLYRPVDVNEHEAIMETQNGTVRHVFDLMDPACSTLNAVKTCFEDTLVQCLFSGEFALPICAAQYPFDSCFSYEYPLGGRVTFDSAIPWDSDLALDSDYLDPGHDGWIGYCWSDRWDSGRSLDSYVGDGSLTAGTHIFTSAAYTFTTADVGRWVWVKSGSRQGRYRIQSQLTASTVRLDTAFDLTDLALDWELLVDVRVLDSTGAAPSGPVEVLAGDGILAAGSDLFETAGAYRFTGVDLGRNLRVTTPAISQYFADGAVTGTVPLPSSTFTSAYSFVAGDQYRYIRVLSGSQQGRYRIVNVLGPNSVELDKYFSVTETSLRWMLEADTRPASLIISAVINPTTVRVVLTADRPPTFVWGESQTGVDWELWDSLVPVTNTLSGTDTFFPSCVYDGFANSFVCLQSADVVVPIQHTQPVMGLLDNTTPGLFEATGPLGPRKAYRAYSAGAGGLRFEARVAGPAGNLVSIQLVNPGADHGSTTVGVVGTAITVTLKRAAGVLLSSMTDIKTALDADASARLLVSTVVTGVGSTLATALGTTLLIGGDPAGESTMACAPL